MERRDWAGVFPALTTPFKEDLTIDYAFLRRHVSWLVDAGCKGIIALGSLSESPTLAFEEKIEILKACKSEVHNRVPLVAGISGLSTAEAVGLAMAANDAGCDGLMVLPPYVYRGDWRETDAHLSALISATPLSCMLYNNPVAYGIDVTPDQIRALTRHANFHAVKESSGDVRRVSAIREIMDGQLAVFAGLDDAIVESLGVGATGWVAGLVNALPAESVRLFNLARNGNHAEAWSLYEWFLPLLRLDTVPKFVQLIKLVQSEVGWGSARVRPPRFELDGPEREEALTLIRSRLARRAPPEDHLCSVRKSD